MIAFLSRRVVKWALLAMAVPVAVWVADEVAERIEGRQGPSKTTKALRMPGRWRRGESLLAD
jgi:hypothetical protein